MVQINFNAQGVKPNTALEAIPSGIYPVVITNSTEKPTKSGNGAYIELEMTIQGGEYANRKVFDRLNIKNPNQQAVDIAYATLSAICHVAGVLHVQDTAQLHGRPFMAVVVKKNRDDQPDIKTNEVKGYKDINGNDPGFAGASPTQNYAPPQPPQAPQPPQQWAPPAAPAPAAPAAPQWAAPQAPQAPQPPAAPQAPQQPMPPAGPAGGAGAPPPWVNQTA